MFFRLRLKVILFLVHLISKKNSILASRSFFDFQASCFSPIYDELYFAYPSLIDNLPPSNARLIQYQPFTASNTEISNLPLLLVLPRFDNLSIEISTYLFLSKELSDFIDLGVSLACTSIHIRPHPADRTNVISLISFKFSRDFIF